jgi:AraC-like DNA-binding protein
VTSGVLPVASRALVGACRRLGIEPVALLERAGVSAAALDDPDARITAAASDALWQAAYAAAGDPALALHAAEQTPYGAFRVLDYLAASGATIGDGLGRVAAYFPLVDRRGALAVEDGGGDRVSVTFRSTEGVPLPQPAQEYTLAILVTRIRHILSPGWRPAEVRLAFPPPDDVREHTRIFGVAPRFGAEVAALALSRADWERPTSASDPGLFAALDDHARRLLERAGSAPLVDRIRAAIAADLPGHEPSLAAVAPRLALSPRSVQRRLAEAGTSFARMVDAVREERAKAALRSDEVSLAEVSWLLGFSEQSAFARAFKRWTGVSPTEWRRTASSRRP